ncbi:MAG: DUF92 domain-containing protein, partial [Cyclonatronaceae bacterium]
FDKIPLVIAFIAAFSFSYIAFFMRWLTLDGMQSAVVVGTITLGLGGAAFTSYLLLFFLSSNLLGLIVRPKAKAAVEVSERRTANQVWANAFWFCLFLILFEITGFWACAAASVAAMAVAIADTWATVIGSSSRKKWIRLISSGEQVPQGTDGAVSLPGTLGALAGAGLMAGLSIFFQTSYGLFFAAVVGISGFSGCMIDSYFGARFQYFKKHLSLFGFRLMPQNDLVNFMATGAGALMALFLYYFLFYFYALV